MASLRRRPGGDLIVDRPNSARPAGLGPPKENSDFVISATNCAGVYKSAAPPSAALGGVLAKNGVRNSGAKGGQPEPRP